MAFPKIGNLAPKFNLPNQNAENVSLGDYKECWVVLYFYPKAMTPGCTVQACGIRDKLKDFKKKTQQLNRLISDNALIYQVVDSDIYGIETLDKQKYISLVTLPTTSLENLEVIDSQMKNGKIVMIKFKITDDEKTK